MKNQFKRIFSVLLVVIMLVPMISATGLTVTAESYSGKCGDNLTWSLDTSTGVLSIDGTGHMYDYSHVSYIPWYSYRTNIKSVVIGDSVISIAGYAFYNCTSLASVTIGDSVSSIGGYAFYYCTSLTSVTIGDSVSSIGAGAFYDTAYYYNSSNWINNVLYIGKCVIKAKSLYGAYSIKEGTIAIADSAFFYCTSLTSVTIPNSVTSIGKNAFEHCESLTSVSIGDSVTSIGYAAFAFCISLTSVTISETVTSIGDYAFEDCSVTVKCYENSYAHTYAVNNGFEYELMTPNVVSGTCGDNLTWTLDTTTGVLTIDGIGDMSADDGYYTYDPYKDSIRSLVIGANVTGIGAGAFSDYVNLENIFFSSSLKTIGNGAFRGCYLITGTLKIPASVTSIGYGAFSDCVHLKKIIIPDSVTYIGDHAFDYMVGNHYYNIYATIYCYDNSAAHVFAEKEDFPYELLDVLSGTCGDALTWKYNTITGVLTIDGTGDMYDFEYIAGKYRPETTAPWNSYYESVTAIIINEGVTSIGDAAFVDLGAATECTISNTVTHIGRKAFNYCSSLTELTIPDSVVSIDDYAFSYCYNLTKAHIGSSVSSMGKVVFDGCSDLTEITVDASNDYFTSADGVLYNKEMTELIQYPCGNQRSEFSIPDTVTSISEYAFHDCETLTSVTVPKSVTSIGEYALHYYNVGYLPLNLTIICYENSYAHTYAINNSFEYELMCDHIYTNYISDNNATCTENGTKTAFCDHGCGTSDTVTIEGTALGHSWSDWITTVEPTYTSDGEMIRFCFKCDAGENKEIPALAAPNKPVVTVNNFTVTITNADNIKDMRYALGEYTTTTEIRNAPGNVALDNGVVTANTVDGSFIYEMPNGGYYSIWIRMKDGTNYIMPLDITRITASVSTYGVKITLHDLFDVKDFYIAKGEYQTYREIKDNGYIVSVTSAKIGNKHDYTYTVYEPGVHTILVRYNDGRTVLFHEMLTVEEPEITVNGLQITVSNIPDVKVIRTAYGEYNTPGDTKRAEGARNFSGKSVIKGAEEYMIQYRENGVVTVVVEYNNGYVKVFHCEIKQKQSNCTQTGSSVLLRNLDGFVMIRYAMGEYSTSAEIKRAKDSKVIKPADLTGEYAIVSGLTKGTYTFCVQFDDESYNYYKITVE